MLSTAYRLKLQKIADRIEKGESIELTEMIWAEKLAGANRSAATILRQARRKAMNPDMVEDGLDDFLNKLDLGSPDPRENITGFDTIDDITGWFTQNKPEDWRQRD